VDFGKERKLRRKSIPFSDVDSSSSQNILLQHFFIAILLTFKAGIIEGKRKL
jgi:hypothetical protein